MPRSAKKLYRCAKGLEKSKLDCLTLRLASPSDTNGIKADSRKGHHDSIRKNLRMA